MSHIGVEIEKNWPGIILEMKDFEDIMDLKEIKHRRDIGDFIKKV